MNKFSDPQKTWNGRFSGVDGFLFGEEPNLWLRASKGWIKPAARTLCIADGEGRNGVWLAEQGCEVTSFDISDVGIAKAQALAARKGVELQTLQSSADTWDWRADQFDVVVAIFIQFATPELREKIFSGIRQTLVPGGVLVIEGYGLRQLIFKTGGPGIAENLYTMPMLMQGFDGWELLASRDANREVHEGTGHHGMSHLVSAVFRKP